MEKLRKVKQVIKIPDSKLIELEKNLALFMLNTDESFVLVGLDYRIVTFNRHFSTLYSKYYGKKVMKGISILDYATQSSVESLKKTYLRIFSGKTFETELIVPVSGDKSHTYSLRFKPAYDENRSIIGAFVSSKNITEIKNMRQALLESEDKYRSIVEQSMIAFFLTSDHDSDMILEVNKAAVDMFGYTYKEFEKMKRDVLFERTDHNLLMLDNIRNNGKAKGEITGVMKNGTRFPCEFSSVSYVDISGNKRITLTVMDISDRKEAEKNASNKEEHLRAIIDNEPECVCTIDKTGKILEMNPAGLRMFQARSAKEVTGKKINGFLHPSDKRAYMAFHKQVAAGNNGHIAFRINGLRHQELYMEANAVALKNEHDRIYAALYVMRDVTDRVENEERIRESEANLRAIFESSTEGLMLLDTAGRIKAFNAMSAENHNLHPSSYKLSVGSKLIDYIEKHRRPYFRQAMTQVLKGESIEYDIDYNMHNGGKRWFHATLTPVMEDDIVTGICITRNDITERKSAEKKISDAVERYNLVAKATHDSIYDWNILTNEVHRSGDGMKMLFGYDQEHAGVDFWRARIHPDDLHPFLTRLKEAFKNPEITTSTMEYRFRKSDGTYAYVFDKGFIIRNEKGTAIRMIGASQDLSDIKASEQQLKDLLNMTSEQNRRLQNFAHIVSHNIRSHSSNIIGLVDLLSEQEDTKNLTENDLFNMLKTSTSKLSETIENLNDIITLQNQLNRDTNNINLRVELEKTCDAINVLISQSGARIVNNIPEDIFVHVIPSYLESILLNLMSNAIKYRSPDRKLIIRLSCKKIKDYYVLTVRDNGIGIDMEKNRDKIFGMYKTFHNNKDARGFGLFITKNQIEAMNGKIEVESTFGKGTTFKLYIYEKN
jgi:PAS domain S-box-containing protein